jgi:hypothetical protein
MRRNSGYDWSGDDVPLGRPASSAFILLEVRFT